MKIPVQSTIIIAFVCANAVANEPEGPLATPDLKSWTEIAQRIVRNSEQDGLPQQADADCDLIESILHQTPEAVVVQLPLNFVFGLGEEINRMDRRFLSPSRVGLEDAFLERAAWRLITEISEGKTNNHLICKCLDVAGALRSNMRSQLRILSQKYPPAPGKTGPAEGESLDSRLQRTSNELNHYIPKVESEFQWICNKLFPGKSQTERV